SAAISAKRNTMEGENTLTVDDVKKIDATIDTLQSHVDKTILAEWKADMLEGVATRGQILERGIKAMRDHKQLEEIRASRPKPVSEEPGPAIHSKSLLPSSGLEAIEAAILIRAGHEKTAISEYGEQVCNSLNGLNRSSFPDIMATALRCCGEMVPHDRD